MDQIEQFIASDGAKLAFRRYGVGRPLLCLSGLTREGSDFDYFRPHLPAGWQMICPDYRGRGASDWTGAASYTIPREAQDVLDLLDHLGLTRVAILGTSRGGMVGMYLGALQRARVTGLCLNDVGPELIPQGLKRILHYLGRNPAAPSVEALARALPAANPGMENVPPSRWLEEARRHSRPRAEGGLQITYDPALRATFEAAVSDPAPNLWPLFDACGPIPLALIRGANSDLLSLQTAQEMGRRRPDMLYVDVPDRAHIPFLDEPASVALIHRWLGQIAA